MTPSARAGAPMAKGPARWRGLWPRPRARGRILGLYMLLLAGALAFGLLLQRTLLLAQLEREVTRQLNKTVEEFDQLAEGRNPETGEDFEGDIEAIFRSALERHIPAEGEALFTIVGGRPFLSTVAPVQLNSDPAFTSLWAATETSAFGRSASAAGEVRWLAVPIFATDGRSAVFVAAIFTGSRRETVNNTLQAGAIVFGGAFLVASALAWVVAGRVLRPIGLLTEAARSVRENNWQARIAVSGDDDIVELGRTFNAMLDRLEDSFATQRRFIDDAGHELRTPITIIRGHLEVGDGDSGESRAIVFDELDRMERMVADLTLLAKSDVPGFLQLQTVAVDELLADAVRRASVLATRNFEVEQSARVLIVADRQRLTQALMNLVSNAVRHAPASTTVYLGCRTVGAAVDLWVRDTGPGIPVAEQARIFERFARGDAAQRNSDGSGLGLAIVAAIVAAHGGHVTVRSSPGTGATFTMTLPIESLGGPAA